MRDEKNFVSIARTSSAPDLGPPAVIFRSFSRNAGALCRSRQFLETTLANISPNFVGDRTQTGWQPSTPPYSVKAYGRYFMFWPRFKVTMGYDLPREADIGLPVFIDS
jgi:hypothetical protein